MKYLLDSCICVHILRGKYNLNVKLEEVGTSNCVISEITRIELLYGAKCSDAPERNRMKVERLCKFFDVIPVSNAIDEFVTQKVRLRKEGKIIEDFDLLIGSTAISEKAVLVTENVRHLERLAGLTIENWVNR